MSHCDRAAETRNREAKRHINIWDYPTTTSNSNYTSYVLFKYGSFQEDCGRKKLPDGKPFPGKPQSPKITSQWIDRSLDLNLKCWYCQGAHKRKL